MLYTLSIIDRAQFYSLNDLSNYRFFIDYLSWRNFYADGFYFQIRLSDDDFQTEEIAQIRINKTEWLKGEWINGNFVLAGISFYYNIRSAKSLSSTDTIAALNKPVPLFNYAQTPIVANNGFTLNQNINGLRSINIDAVNSIMLDKIPPVILEQKVWMESGDTQFQSMGVLYTGGKVYFGFSSISEQVIWQPFVESVEQPTGIQEYKIKELFYGGYARGFMYAKVDWNAYSINNVYSATTGIFLKNSFNTKDIERYFGTEFICTPNDNLVDFFTMHQGMTIKLSPGEYDIIEHYKQKFGDDYWDNYTGYTSGFGIIGAGLPLYSGTKLICSPGAKVSCKYSGENQNVKDYFSAFACGNGYEINGLWLDCENCRYAIHDDFNTVETQFNVTIKNSHIENTEQAIGGGMGVCGNYLFENNYIESSVNWYDMRYHNNANNAKNRLTFIGNYFAKRLRIANYGVSAEHTTECFISNNSMMASIIHDNEDPNYTIENIIVYEWNNVIR